MLYGEEFLRGIALEFNFLERLLENIGVLCEKGIGRPTLISLTHRLASLAATEKVIIQAFLLSCALRLPIYYSDAGAIKYALHLLLYALVLKEQNLDVGLL